MALAEQTIDDEIAADWKEISAKFAAPDEMPAPEPETVEAPEVKPDRARDEGGRFAKEPDAKADSTQNPGKVVPRAKVSGVQPDRDQTAEGKATQANPVEMDPASGGNRDLTRAPSSWKPAARDAYATLPDAIKAEIHRREADFLSGQSQLLPDAKFGSEIRKVVEPYRMLIETEGGTAERAIGDLLRTAATLRMGTQEQKVMAIAQVARQFGVDLRAFQASQAQPNGQPPAAGQPTAQPSYQDPRVDQILAHLNQQTQQRQQQEQAQLEGIVTQWMGEVDAQGQPTRPYLQDVMNEMAALVPQIRQGNPGLSHHEVLQQAYDRATWGNPEVRALLQQKLQQQQEQQRASENQNRVREARRAASVNVPRRASTPTPGKPGSLEDTIASTARELGLIT